jgi:radical SAM/Cys-rich protein
MSAEQQAFFNHLFCITNMPLGRFLEYLNQSGNSDEYWQSLENAFNPGTVENLMCRNTISIDWTGALFDCDFNQVLGLPVDHGLPAHVSSFDLNSLQQRLIRTGNHCYGCTAGLGSSCQGELAASE